MPKEINELVEISVVPDQAGVRLTTTKTIEESEIFLSLEDAVRSKDLESHFKKTIGGTAIGIGLAAFLGGLILLGSEIGDERIRVVGSLAGVTSGVFVTVMGNQIYESGLIARQQWRQFKEVLGAIGSSVKSNQETAG